MSGLGREKGGFIKEALEQKAALCYTGGNYGGEALNPSTFIPIIALWLIIAMMLRRRRRAVCIRSIIEKRKKKGNYEMKELATKFIGKDCIIYAFDGSQYTGSREGIESISPTTIDFRVFRRALPCKVVLYGDKSQQNPSKIYSP